MSYILGSPFESVASKYYQHQFNGHNDGEFLFKIRQIYQDCIGAMASGRIQYWFPSKPMCKEAVESILQKIDKEWDKETYRDKHFKQGPRFNENLTWEQKACLVERILDVMKDMPQIKPIILSEAYGEYDWVGG